MIDLILKASLILAILWAFYKIFLEKESFFAANRFYLLGCLVLAFSLPFVSLPRLVDNQGLVSIAMDYYDTEVPSSSVPHPPSASGQEEEPHRIESSDGIQMGFGDWILVLYFFGVAVFLLNFVYQVVRLLSKAWGSHGKIRDVNGVIVNDPAVEDPHSFFNYIFINPERYDYDTYEQIILHEKIHVRKLHSVDLLLAEIATIVLWFNPFIWLLRKEISKNIEYETDELVLNENAMEKEHYQMNLLRIATHRKPLAIATNYNQSLIKQRIFRMNAKKSSPHTYWKYAFIVPLILAMLLVINKPTVVLAGSNEPIDITQGSQASVYTSDCQALLAAVKARREETVKELLKTVDPDCTYREDGEPRSPLVAAARLGDLDIGKLLIAAGADVEYHAWGDETPLMAASAHGHLDFVEYLVSKNAEINKELRGDGSALLVAAREGHLDIVRYLVGSGADVNSQVAGDGTPLICAVRSNYYEISKFLLENGADPYQVSPGDEYAMFHARMSNNREMIELLKKYEK